MRETGNFCLLALFVLAVYASLAAAIGAKRDRIALVVSGARAIVLGALLASLAVASLAAALVKSDFSFEYVANYSNRDLPLMYKLASLWAGNDGSLLFWLWLLVVFAATAVWTHRNSNVTFYPYVITVFGLVIAYFTYLSYWVCNPFEQLGVVMGSGEARLWTPADGRGLNPLLQHPIMAIHPPILYIGYVGFVVPFAFCIAALYSRSLDVKWLTTTRRWTLFAWFFLGTGILLGGRWAYVELGWGGYWAWDPVENASLMPWLISTAYLHSVMVQERKGMLKVWNVALVMLTYLLCIFGTFLTRSGVVSSVHAFAESDFAWQFLVFIAVAAAISGWLLYTRRHDLKSENELESIASREASFLFNNLLLLVACFAVLWGTLFPVLSEAARGEKVSVGPAFFNEVNIPIALALLFLTGVGPLLSWRGSSSAALRRHFTWPSIAGALTGIVLAAGGVRHVYAWICFVLAAFVVVTIVQEFHRGIVVRREHKGLRYAPAALDLIAVNTRRYGGYVVHFGMVLIFIGVAGSAFDEDAKVDLSPGDSMTVGAYELAFERYDNGDTPNYDYTTAVVELRRDGEPLGTFDPQRHLYRASGQVTTEVRRYANFREDVYIVFAGVTQEGKAIVQAFVNPLVRWVWIGGIVVFCGSFIAMIPNRRELNVVRERMRGGGVAWSPYGRRVA